MHYAIPVRLLTTTWLLVHSTTGLAEPAPNPASYSVPVMTTGFKAPPGMRTPIREGPNFAGKYYVAMTPCGGPCRSYQIIDLGSGKEDLTWDNVFQGLHGPDEESYPILCGRRDSNLGFSHVDKGPSEIYGIWFVVENGKTRPLGSARKMSYEEVAEIERLFKPQGCW